MSHSDEQPSTSRGPEELPENMSTEELRDTVYRLENMIIEAGFLSALPDRGAAIYLKLEMAYTELAHREKLENITEAVGEVALATTKKKSEVKVPHASRPVTRRERRPRSPLTMSYQIHRELDPVTKVRLNQVTNDLNQIKEEGQEDSFLDDFKPPWESSPTDAPICNGPVEQHKRNKDGAAEAKQIRLRDSVLDLQRETNDEDTTDSDVDMLD